MSEQQHITRWFDEVYRRKGERYLRPARAYLVFAELLRLEPGRRLLDIACGTGQMFLAARNSGCDLCGIDISGQALRLSSARAPEAMIAQANAERLPFESGTFDFITCLGSLERFLDRRLALQEMRRVGTKRARYCLLLRNSNTMRWRLFSGGAEASRSRGHQDADTLDNWRQLLESCGLRVIDVLPDQYLLHRRTAWLGLGLKRVDFRQPVRGRGPLQHAHQFTFILEKQP